MNTICRHVWNYFPKLGYIGGDHQFNRSTAQLLFAACSHFWVLLTTPSCGQSHCVTVRLSILRGLSVPHQTRRVSSPAEKYLYQQQFPQLSLLWEGSTQLQKNLVGLEAWKLLVLEEGTRCREIHTEMLLLREQPVTACAGTPRLLQAHLS